MGVAAMLLLAISATTWTWSRASETEYTAPTEMESATLAAQSAQAREPRARQATEEARNYKSRALAALSTVALSAPGRSNGFAILTRRRDFKCSR